MDTFKFRTIRQEEIEEAIEIEQICFPPHEACSPKSMRERVKVAEDLFLVAVDQKSGTIAGFLNGIATMEAVFRDEFFTDATLHNPKGSTVMLLGLDVREEYRRRGLATAIVKEYARREKERGRGMLILTCLEEKVTMYENMGLKDLGWSNSTWGDEPWHEMSYEL